MAHQLSRQAAAMASRGATLFRNGSEAKISGLCAIALAFRIEQTKALEIPAARRPKPGDIQTAIRLAFGGDDKETDRGRYDTCSLGFRLLRKLEKQHEALLAEAVLTPDPKALGKEVMRLCGHDTEAAIRAWVAGEARQQTAEKKPIDKALDYLGKKAAELSDDDMAALMDWCVAETARRAQVADARAAA